MPSFRPPLLLPHRALSLLLTLLALGACGGDTPSGRAENEPAGEGALGRFRYARTQMGVPFRLVIYARAEEEAQAASAAAFARVSELNAILSDYDPQSEAMQLCAKSGDGELHEVSPELRTLLALSGRWWQASDGAFDPTVGPFVQLWRAARREKRLPGEAALAEARERVGLQHVRLTPVDRLVRLERPGMRLDFGGIAKGFALDDALQVLRRRGIQHALAEAGGDIAVMGAPPGEAGWRVAITPLEEMGTPTQHLLLRDMAVATSGDRYQFVELGGKRYSHIVDPRTGLGLTERSLVTVVASTGAAADAMATVVSVLGPEKGIAWIDRQQGAAALPGRGAHGHAFRTHEPALEPASREDERTQVERSMAKKRLGIGILGTGWVAGAHIENFKQIDGCEIVGVCSRKQERAAAKIAQHNLVGCRGLRGLRRDARP